MKLPRNESFVQNNVFRERVNNEIDEALTHICDFYIEILL